MDRAWLHVRGRHTSRRLLDGYGAIMDARCAAWNQPDRERLGSVTSYLYLQQASDQAGRHQKQ